MYNRIIFVSTANTSRSPMAMTIYKSIDVNSNIEVISRGIVVLFEEPANPKAEMVLNNHDMSMEGHVSKQLTSDDVDDTTLILAMSDKQKKEIIEDLGISNNVYTIAEFAEEMTQLHDPYGGDFADYEKCYQELVRIIKKIVYKLQEE